MAETHPDLFFTQEQLLLTALECKSVATQIYGRSIKEEQFTDKDRAFIQRSFLIAIDHSEKAGIIFDLYSSAISASVSQSVKNLAKSFSKKVAKRWFKQYLDDTPKISPVGCTGVRKALGGHWAFRVESFANGIEDDAMLPNYLVQ